MSSTELQSFIDRLNEAQLYCEQGLREGAVEILRDLLGQLATSGLDPSEMDRVRSRAEACLRAAGEETGPSIAEPSPLPLSGVQDVQVTDPSQIYEYAKALQDGQFWEEAVHQFKRAAASGYRALECWERCGDNAVKMEHWDEAIRYYEVIYTDPSVLEEHRAAVLVKITRCSQKQKALEARSALSAKSETVRSRQDFFDTRAREDRAQRDTAVPASISSLTEYTASRFSGKVLRSWEYDGQYLPGEPLSYRVLDVLYVGTSSLVVELEREETGERVAGQAISAPFNRNLQPESLAGVVYALLMTESSHLVKVADLAQCDGHYFIVREHLPLSLEAVLKEGGLMPVPLATYLAYQILVGLGDLHLHMGRDERIRNMFHLDLRPSRILLHRDRTYLKINNGGLWKELQACNPQDTAVQKLPLQYLAYRAPEQFRPYLSRRKPPVFTDIYLFGTIFYEMLTGIPAFRASSFEEYEIAHCEQYPTPPKVWRPEISEELSNTVMKCLVTDPMRRWRSTTQIALILEKTFDPVVHPARDESFIEFFQSIP